MSKGKSQLRIGVVMSYINMAIGSLIPMFYTPIMLELLGQSEYGLYKLSGSVTSYLSLISFGIGSAVVRYLVKYRTEGDKDGEEGVFALFNVVFFIISILTVIAGIVIVFFLEPIYGKSINNPEQMTEMRILVLILSFTTALSFLCTPYNAVVSSREKFVFLQLINIISTVLAPIINIIVLYLGFKSIGLATSSLILNILIRVIYIAYVKKFIKLKPNYKKMPKHLVREILGFSFWVFLSNVTNQLHAATDTAIIGAIPALATLGVAVYNIGATFNQMMNNFSTGLLSLLTPRVNKMVFSNRSKTELTDFMIKIGRIQSYIVSLICSGFIAFGIPFIKLWAGEDYEEAYWVALVTMIPACVPLVQNVAYNIIVAMNKHRFRSIVYLSVAILNVILTIPASLKLGVVGAALMTGICSIIGSLITMNWYYWKKIGLEIPRFWKSIAKIFVVPILLCASALIISNFINFDRWIVLLVGIVVYFILFFVLSWFFVMNSFEKDIFTAPIKKIIGLRHKREKGKSC